MQQGDPWDCLQDSGPIHYAILHEEIIWWSFIFLRGSFGWSFILIRDLIAYRDGLYKLYSTD